MQADGPNGRLGDFVSLQRGTTYKSRLLGLPGPVLLGLASIQRNGGFRDDSLQTYGGDSPSKLVLESGDLYVSLKDVTQSADLLGAVARVPASIRGRLTQDTVKLVFKAVDAPRDYIYWLLRTTDYRNYCRAHATGTTNLGLPREDFLAFPVPPLTLERNALVALLNSIERKANLNRDQNQTLEALASALFKSWFVDFDPVMAKRDGKLPVGVPPDLVDLFPGHFEECELGPIPQGWHVTRVDQAFEINPRRELAQGTDAPYLEMAAMPTAGHAPRSWVCRATGSGMRFVNGDTLMARITPCLENGKTAFVDFLEAEEVGWGSTEYIVIRSKPPMPLVASYLLARSDDFRAFAIQSMTGSSGRQRVGADVLGTYELALPSDPRLLQAFGTIVEPFFQMARANSAESRALAELRDTLLAPLLSGDLTIKAVEKVAGAVL